MTRMFRHWISCVLTVCFWTTLCLKAGSFENPINGADKPDPCVFKWMGRYYLFATNDLSWNHTILKSENLANWDSIPIGLSNIPNPPWWDSWAPDVFFYNGEFYIYTSGQVDPENRSTSPHTHRIFSSTVLTGPYTQEVYSPVVSDNNNLDGSVFVDDNGQAYFVYSSIGWGGRSPTVP